MKIKTRDLIGPALRWAVEQAEGGSGLGYGERYEPDIDWSQGGPIIERERIGVWDSAEEAHKGEWAAATNEWMSMDVESPEFLNSPMPYHGPTPLVAAMRCYVASTLGDEVDVPEELT